MHSWVNSLAFIFLFPFKDVLLLEHWLCCVSIAVHGLSLVVASGGYPLVVVCGLLIAVASLVERRL